MDCGFHRYFRLVLLFILPYVAWAQDASDPSSLCFRGRPLPECKSFLITEAEVGYRLIDPEGHDDFDGLVLGLDIGWMRNLTSDYAVGLTLGANNRHITLGPRYRRWLTQKAALDVGLSAAWRSTRIRTVELHTGLNYNDRIGVWLDATHDFEQGNPGLAVGVRAGAEPGIIAYGGAAVTFGVLLYLLLEEESRR